ncbi:MAG: hypothetical protein OXC41_03515 [Gammaproteobacteria bacterium]|nr:hypothetical protein [Gammaproteobacteria bacterium]
MLTGLYANERSIQMNQAQMKKMEKDPWPKMAIETQFRQLEVVKEYGDPDRPATLTYLEEEEINYDSDDRDAIDRTLRVLHWALTEGKYAKAISVVIWKDQPLSVVMQLALDSPGELISEAVEYSLY